jgi:hypothetical protein
MMNTGTEVLNQVMNRWAANFRAAQATQVMNEKTIKNLGIFDLQSDEHAVLSELNAMLANVKTSEVWA